MKEETKLALIHEILSLLKSEDSLKLGPPEKWPSPLNVGNNVLIRTVTHYFTGQIVGLSDTEVLIKDASWIADTGRFTDSFGGTLNEVEPYPEGVVSVGRGAIIDVSFWSASLPRVQK